MAARHLAWASALLVALAACGGGQSETSRPQHDLAPPALAREAPLPDVPETTTPPAPRPVDPGEADRVARELIRIVAAAADAVLAEHGTYDVDRATISSLAGGVAITSLEEAAVADGVVYDSFGRRVTLHVESGSGRWFCLDLSPAGRDHGFGATFSSSLATCTDGVLVSGWGNAFSATGPDEAAIAGLWDSLARALETGSVAGAYDLFRITASCPVEELERVWPPGLALIDPDTYSLEGVTVAGSSAISEVTIGAIPTGTWRLEHNGTAWALTADPCLVLADVANERARTAARELLQQGLHAVRTTFVVERDFAFGPERLASVDGDLLWSGEGPPEFGELFYSGTTGAGVVVTKGAGVFLCAVESATETTRYGQAMSVEDVDRVDTCGASS